MNELTVTVGLNRMFQFQVKRFQTTQTFVFGQGTKLIVTSKYFLTDNKII